MAFERREQSRKVVQRQEGFICLRLRLDMAISPNRHHGIHPINLTLICQEFELGLTFCRYQLSPEPCSIPSPTIPFTSARKTWRLEGTLGEDGEDHGNHHRKRIYARKTAARAAMPANAKDPPTELAAPVKGGGLLVYLNTVNIYQFIWGIYNLRWLWCNGGYCASGVDRGSDGVDTARIGTGRIHGNRL